MEDNILYFRRHTGGRKVALHVAIEGFLADLEVEGIQPRTIREHRRELRQYASWLEKEGLNWIEVQLRDLSAYTRTRAKRGPSSRAALIGSLRRFYRWAVEQGDLVASPADGLRTPKRPKRAPKSLNLEEVRKLLEYLREHEQDGLRQQRDRILILTGLYTGLRARELAELQWAQVDVYASIVTIIVSKMNVGRSVRLHPDLVPELVRWREAQGLTGPVFALGKVAIVANRVGKVCRRYAKILGIPLSAHVLRHTFATWSLRRSGNIYAVSKALGHASVRHTEVYLLVDPRDGDAAVDGLPGADQW